MTLDRSPHVQHPNCRSPRALFFALSSSSGPAAFQLQSSCCFCITGHGPRFQVRPQGSPPPLCLCTVDNPAASRPAPPHGATLTRDRAQLVCVDHVHMLQACSSSNHKTHACWRPALGPTLLTQLPLGAGSMHTGRKSVSISLRVPARLSGSSPRSPTWLACPWLPESLFCGLAASLLSSGPAAPPDPFQRSCPSKTCYSSPLIHTL